MKVRLSYSVDEEDVLEESAKLLGLCGSDFQHAAQLFTEVQTILRGEDGEERTTTPNTFKAL